MSKIYSLVHLSRTIPDGEYTHDFFCKSLGYFSTKEKLLQATEYYKKLPGFQDQNEVHKESPIDTEDKAGFYIYDSDIDGESSWEGGFITDYYEEEDQEGAPWTRELNLPLWLKGHNLAGYTLEDIDKLFIAKYGKNNYPQGLGSEYLIVRLFIEA